MCVPDVQNNPIKWGDPYGLSMSDVPGAVVTAVSSTVNAISNIATNGPPEAQAVLAFAGVTGVAPLAVVVAPEAAGASAPALTGFIYKMATMSPGKPTLQTVKKMFGL